MRRGRIPWTRETWIGQPFRGHMTGFPSVDVRSIGAGGGSIAWVDDGGLLHVGPNSAGAVPGPGLLRPRRQPADRHRCVAGARLYRSGLLPRRHDEARHCDARAAAIARDVARPLGLTLDEAAAAIMALATENMVQAIEDITVNQGIDPREAVLVGGGGAAGLNSVPIARRLGCRALLIPEVGAALSAAGALMSDLTAQFQATLFTRSERFRLSPRVNAVLDGLESQAQTFIAGPGQGSLEQTIRFWARRATREQVWELEVPLLSTRFARPCGCGRRWWRRSIARIRTSSRSTTPARRSRSSAGAFPSPAASASHEGGTLAQAPGKRASAGSRMAYFPGHGRYATVVRRFEAIAAGERIAGPAIIESSFTTVVVDPGAVAERRPSGSLSLDPATADRGSMT